MKKLFPFDAHLPESLKRTQIWFGGVISTPLAEQDQIRTLAPSGLTIAEEAAHYIAPSPTLKPYERIQLYNQQYWWRLINTLQDAYPFLWRLFGYEGFKYEIAIPYFTDYPPDHWSINQIGDKLPSWIRKNYKAQDRKMILNAAILDYGCYKLLYYPIAVSIDLPSDIDNLMNLRLGLQPNISLYQFPFDLFTYRSHFIKKPVEYWEENSFPKLKLEKTYGLLRRTSKDYIGWSIISAAEYEILKKIQQITSIDALSEWLEKEANEISVAAAENLQKWFKNWSSKGYLIDANSKGSRISRSTRGVRKKGKN